MDETREKRISLLVGAEIINRKQYDNKGLKLTFKDLLTWETYYRTFSLTKKEGSTISNFLKVILDDSNETNQLLENPNELAKACRLNDHKFFSLDLEDSERIMNSTGKPFRNVEAISKHQPTFDEQMLYIEKGMINLETEKWEKGIADLEM